MNGNLDNKKRKRVNKNNIRTLTDDSFNDYLNNEAKHEIYSRRKQLELMKTLKLVFYKDEVDENKKAEYLNYYIETHPKFGEKYFNSSKKERQLLLNKAIKKAKKAYDDFASHNIRLVINIALKEYKKCFNLPIEKIDLIQEGNIGMLEAIKRFDIGKKAAFSTYAIYWIKQRINRYINNKGRIIHLSTNILEEFRKLQKAEKELFEKLNYMPTIEQLSEHMDKEVYEVSELITLRYNYKTLTSLNTSVGDTENTELGEFIADDDISVEQKIEQKIFAEDIMDIIENSNLSDREKEIVIKRAGLNGNDYHGLKPLAENYNVTPERIRQIDQNAKFKLSVELVKRGYGPTEIVQRYNDSIMNQSNVEHQKIKCLSPRRK